MHSSTKRKLKRWRKNESKRVDRWIKDLNHLKSRLRM